MAKTWIKVIASMAAFAATAYALVMNSYDLGVHATANALCKYGEQNPNETFQEFFSKEG